MRSAEEVMFLRIMRAVTTEHSIELLEAERQAREAPLTGRETPAEATPRRGKPEAIRDIITPEPISKELQEERLFRPETLGKRPLRS